MSSTHDDPMIGRVIDDYEIMRLIGKGGMAYVYEAVESATKTDRALKIITLSHDRASELSQRFAREVRISKKLNNHPNVIRVFKNGEIDQDKYYIAMELIRGETLTQRLKRYKHNNEFMPYNELIKIMQQVASALDYVHMQKAIHRDIKPSNIMIEKSTERVVLMDFGLVMDSGNNTTMGTAFGTPRYIAPEQAISSQQARPESDIYALGIIIYEVLTGQTPFDEDSAMSMALSHITNDPPPLQQTRPDIPEAVSDVVLKALRKQPEDRFPRATDFINALVDAVRNSTDTEIEPFATVHIDIVEDDFESTPALTAEDIQHLAEEPAFVDDEPASAHSTTSDTKDRQRSPGRSPMRMLGIAFVFIIIFAAVAFAFFGGEDKNDNNGGDEATTNPVAINTEASTEDTNSQNGDNTPINNEVDLSSIAPDGSNIVLVYNSNGLLILNGNPQALTLSQLRLLSPDASIVFDFGVSSVTQVATELASDSCFAVWSSAIDTPAACTELSSFELFRKVLANTYWVWDSTLASTDEHFQVEYNGSIVAECVIDVGQCSFAINGQ